MAATDDPLRFEIWLAHLAVGKSEDVRPCIVLGDEEDREWAVMALSSNLSLYRSLTDFLFRADDPDFVATGLRRESYVLGDRILTASKIDFVVKWGRLEGELARRFEDWAGW